MNRVLTTSGLSGGYGRSTVLTDISINVESDEIVALFGANGAGKTTLLRALSGALPTQAGDVDLVGHPIGKLSPARRARAGLAHVPEGRHTFGAMTVADNLAVAALIDGGGHRFSQSDVYDLFPRLGDRQAQIAGSMSGGEQQMLAIGRALVTSPRLLAIDEMSAGLAPIIVEQLVTALATLRGMGLGILLVEQSPHFVADVVDRVYLIESGRIVGDGTLDDLGGADALAALYLGIS